MNPSIQDRFEAHVREVTWRRRLLVFIRDNLALSWRAMEGKAREMGLRSYRHGHFVTAETLRSTWRRRNYYAREDAFTHYRSHAMNFEGLVQKESPGKQTGAL